MSARPYRLIYTDTKGRVHRIAYYWSDAAIAKAAAMPASAGATVINVDTGKVLYPYPLPPPEPPPPVEPPPVGDVVEGRADLGDGER